LYARGPIEEGRRKSLEPMVARLGGGKVEYEALQHFLADSAWDAEVIERAVVERVCAAIEPQAWVLDDTGVVKDGKHSPGSSVSILDAGQAGISAAAGCAGLATGGSSGVVRDRRRGGDGAV
jgi:SRSO17 transposase